MGRRTRRDKTQACDLQKNTLGTLLADVLLLFCALQGLLVSPGCMPSPWWCSEGRPMALPKPRIQANPARQLLTCASSVQTRGPRGALLAGQQAP